MGEYAQKRQKVLEECIDFLRGEIPPALQADKLHSKLWPAFPEGVLPTFDDDGRMIELAAVPNFNEWPNGILEKAQSDPNIYDAVLARAGFELKLTGKIDNIEVRLFVAEHLIGLNVPPAAKGPGRKTSASHNVTRNTVIRLAVSMAERAGLPPTRGHDNIHGDSACAVVAEAMSSLKFIPSSERQIEEILKSGDRVKLV